MHSENHFREPAGGASRCAYRICSLMPEQISGRRKLLCKEIRKPRYHGRALDGALMRGRLCGKPGGTANKEFIRPGILNRIPGFLMYKHANDGGKQRSIITNSLTSDEAAPKGVRKKSVCA